MTSTQIAEELAREVDAMLADADAALQRGWPGDPGTRQPVHTLYVPADRVSPDEDVPGRYGRDALDALDTHAADLGTAAAALGWREEAVADVWTRVRGKLEREPVEDLRLDLEDGYGLRPDDEEDRDAVRAAQVFTQLARRAGEDRAPDGARPPFSFGVRVKSLEAPTRRRGLRSLELVVATLAGDGGVPEGFVVTLPKVTSTDQVRAMVHICERLESAYGLPARRLRFEVQVETPQAIVGADGTATVAALVHAADRRCTGLHYGTYDYSASVGVAAAYQSMEHPAADHAKAVMQVAAAGTGVRVCDGSTNVLPVGDREAVHHAWALHARLVRRSLERGFYQGWDLHAAQLPTRYLATYAFYREGLGAAAARLRAYATGSAGGVLDEPATAFALASFLTRGVDCGALDLDEVTAATGIDDAALLRFARRPAPRPVGGDGREAGVRAFNALPAAEVRRRLLAVCASRRWADVVAAQRPFATADDLQAAAARALGELPEGDVDEALAGHPRIGERRSGPEGAASRQEQSGVAAADPRVLDELAKGNREYEQRFGHVYLVCASGRSAEELLDVLRSRLGNDPETERTVLRAELAKINALRLGRLLEELGGTS